MAEEMKLKIIKVEEEENSDGLIFYKMTLESKTGTYERGITQRDWESEQDRRSVEKHWLKSIGVIEAAKERNKSKTKEERKAEIKAKIKDIEGIELTDE